MNTQSRIFRVLSCATMLAALILTSATALSGGRPRPAVPLDGSTPQPDSGLIEPTSDFSSVSVGTGLFSLTLAADHIISQQCLDGGWGWPHNDCVTTYNNITGPITLGLMEAYTRTTNAGHLAASVVAGDFDLLSVYGNGEARFGTLTPDFLNRLSDATGDPTYANFVLTDFLAELAGGTYSPSDYDTAGWIGAVQAARAGTWVNLLPWEFHTLPSTTGDFGLNTQANQFRNALLDGFNTLDNTQPATVFSDIIGLAGGVRGLALSNVVTFVPIVSPNHALINGTASLCVLAQILADLQNPDGSWNWHSDLSSLGGAGETDKDTQTTAYAILALVEAQLDGCGPFPSELRAARAWLWTMQDVDGGFFSYPTGSHNTEVEGEATLALVKRPGDVDGDEFVNVFDLISVLSAWGSCIDCPQDFNGDNLLNVTDLLILLSAWGPP